MRLKNVPGSREVIGESRFVIHEPELQKGKWKEVFGNENPIHIEIGMGKGRFIMGMAGQHPEVNFIENGGRRASQRTFYPYGCRGYLQCI